MKSLEERKKQRAAQRAEALADSPNQTTIADSGDGTGDETEFDGMTIDRLREVAKNRFETEVPKDKTKKDEILEFVKNLAAFKAQEEADDAGEQTGSGWKQGN